MRMTFAPGRRYIEAFLELLEEPDRLYAQANGQLRRQFNQAIFKRIYVVNDEVIGDELHSPLAELLAAERGWAHLSNGSDVKVAEDAAIDALERRRPETSKATSMGGLAEFDSRDVMRALLAGVYQDADCSRTSMVDPRRFELLTSSMRTRRATNCAKGPCCLITISPLGGAL